VTEEPNNTNTEIPVAVSSPSVEALEKKLAEEQSRAESYLAKWQRAQADFQNYQKRADRERAETADSAKNSVLLALLPVVDDFELAVKLMPAEISTSEWANGILMIERKLKGFLESYGVTAIETSGRPFDPKYHEAVMKADGEEGMIIRELRKGYMIRDTVLRPSLVVVGSGQKSEGARKEHRQADRETATNNKERLTGANKKEEHNG